MTTGLQTCPDRGAVMHWVLIAGHGVPVALALALLSGGAVTAAAQPAPLPPGQPSVALPVELARVLTDYEAAWQAKDAAEGLERTLVDRVRHGQRQLPPLTAWFSWRR